MRRRTHDCRFCDRSHPLPPQLVDITVFNHWARALRPRVGWRGLHPPINRAEPSRAPCTNWCASAKAARRVAFAGSFAVVVAGLYWFVERVFLAGV